MRAVKEVRRFLRLLYQHTPHFSASVGHIGVELTTMRAVLRILVAPLDEGARDAPAGFDAN